VTIIIESVKRTTAAFRNLQSSASRTQKLEMSSGPSSQLPGYCQSSAPRAICFLISILIRFVFHPPADNPWFESPPQFYRAGGKEKLA